MILELFKHQKDSASLSAVESLRVIMEFRQNSEYILTSHKHTRRNWTLCQRATESHLRTTTDLFHCWTPRKSCIVRMYIHTSVRLVMIIDLEKTLVKVSWYQIDHSMINRVENKFERSTENSLAWLIRLRNRELVHSAISRVPIMEVSPVQNQLWEHRTKFFLWKLSVEKQIKKVRRSVFGICSECVKRISNTWIEMYENQSKQR